MLWTFQSGCRPLELVITLRDGAAQCLAKLAPGAYFSIEIYEQNRELRGREVNLSTASEFSTQPPTHSLLVVVMGGGVGLDATL